LHDAKREDVAKDDTSQSIDGSCLCGAVTFTLLGEFDGFFLCHCARCRKDTGSAHAANLFATSAALIWLTGEDRVRTYQLPGTRHQRSFCPTCGSGLPGTQMDGAAVLVPAGCIDTPLDRRPDAHICCADRAAWDIDLASVPELAGLPGSA